MRVSSSAGTFETKVERIDIEQDQLVMVGKTGIWQSKTYFEPRELLKISLMMLKLKVFLYFLRLPLLFFKKS